jgi:serine/threonine protein kinase
MMKLRHPNLVSLLHIITKEKPTAIVLEYMMQGPFSEWLGHAGEAASGEDLLFILNQVASGMTELARQGIGKLLSLKDGPVACGFDGSALTLPLPCSPFRFSVHRDLAARNVLIGENLLAKVSDYGLSRNMAIGTDAEDCYYKLNTSRPMPIRWMVRDFDVERGFCLH